MKKMILSLAAGCMLTSAYGQQISQKEVARIINTLAADDMQGRQSGTPSIDKAAAFISNEFRKAGLAPLSGEQNYLQSFSRYGLHTVATTLTVNGVAQNWPVLTIGASRHVQLHRDTAQCLEIKVTNADELRAVLGKRKSMQKNIVAWLAPSLDAYLANLEGSISSRMYATEQEVPADTATRQMVLILEREPLKADDNWSVDQTRSIHAQQFTNVVGMIKGAAKPDEYVIYSGHYDHLGILPPVDGDSIANGADDDASGTTAVIMLADYYKKKRPARSLIFVAFTAEEMGGYGSAYFSQQMDPAKVVAMFNIEMIGKESKFGKNSAFITGFEKSDFGTILQKNLSGSAFRFYPDPYPEQNLFYRSDNANLAKLGVPAHTISTTQIDKDKYYHTVKDEVSTLDVKNITDIIKAIAVSSGTIVNGTSTPTRITPVSQ
ncbi:M28 family peptidase [Chitinophaga qingshengii]|uniref:M28 family peptidase n=1 Tax=Chitinophaga qingshengii TaxID=1569794 RepID=A0ABR7TU12_9BACT|nr:M28 family peptidase [Chitinophaga qingshengii]MBC9933967.1 M28 family peptidase [Chitinophaga qingshengii]